MLILVLRHSPRTIFVAPHGTSGYPSVSFLLPRWNKSCFENREGHPLVFFKTVTPTIKWIPYAFFSSIFLIPMNNAQYPEWHSALVRPASKHPSLDHWSYFLFLKPCKLLSHGYSSSLSGVLFLAAVEASPASAIQEIYFPVLTVNWFLLPRAREDEKLHLCSAAVYLTRFSQTRQGTREGCHSAQPEDAGS